MRKARTTKAVRRLLVADHHPMMRQGLARLIEMEPGLAVPWEAGTAAQALDLVIAHQPDLALLDLSLPDKSGLELVKDIHHLYPALPTLVVSAQDEALFAERVLRAGGQGYIMKQETGQRLIQAIRCVLGGQIYLSERMSAKALEILSGRRPEAESPLERLTGREFEIFQLLGQGQGTRDIAQRLRLSIKTVEVHRASIRRKVEIKTGNDLVRYAIRWTESQED